MDGGAWKAEVSGVTEARTQLSDFTFTFCRGRGSQLPEVWRAGREGASQAGRAFPSEISASTSVLLRGEDSCY